MKASEMIALLTMVIHLVCLQVRALVHRCLGGEHECHAHPSPSPSTPGEPPSGHDYHHPYRPHRHHHHQVSKSQQRVSTESELDRQLEREKSWLRAMPDIDLSCPLPHPHPPLRRSPMEPPSYRQTTRQALFTGSCCANSSGNLIATRPHLVSRRPALVRSPTIRQAVPHIIVHHPAPAPQAPPPPPPPPPPTSSTHAAAAATAAGGLSRSEQHVRKNKQLTTILQGHRHEPYNKHHLHLHNPHDHQRGLNRRADFKQSAPPPPLLPTAQPSASNRKPDAASSSSSCLGKQKRMETSIRSADKEHLLRLTKRHREMADMQICIDAGTDTKGTHRQEEEEEDGIEDEVAESLRMSLQQLRIHNDEQQQQMEEEAVANKKRKRTTTTTKAIKKLKQLDGKELIVRIRCMSR